MRELGLSDALGAVAGGIQKIINTATRKLLYEFRITGDVAKPDVKTVPTPILTDHAAGVFGSMLKPGAVVTTSGEPGWLAGLLGACITAPHLLGPLVARSLDSCRDGRVLIAWACIIHGATLAAAVLLYPVTWPALTGFLLEGAGIAISD